MEQQSGSFRLFRAAGINVYVHWSWFLVAVYQYQMQQNAFSTPVWFVLEYLSLFGIVVLHEFGHALACRQVGGIAEKIILWPLGGIAYVSPPPRPGALLWSIVAGPLVNVMLLVPTIGLVVLSDHLGWEAQFPDLAHYLLNMAVINAVLLIFNMLPIYPLDGGQTLQAILWFLVGRVTSLVVVAWIGVAGGMVCLGLAALYRDAWLAVIAVFITLRAWSGIQYSRILQKRLTAPRHEHLHCPACGEAPPQGAYWRCEHCGAQFDIVDSQARCPRCGSAFDQIVCPNCYEHHPAAKWTKADDPEPVQPPV